MRARGITLALCLVLVATLPVGASGGADDYIASIEKYRQDRETRLKAERGWLSVTGLYWLEEGDSTIGADPSSTIVLPEGSAPAHVGVISYTGGKATIKADPRAGVTCRGEAVTTMTLRPDTEDETDILQVNDLSAIKVAHYESVKAKEETPLLNRAIAKVKQIARTALSRWTSGMRETNVSNPPEPGPFVEPVQLQIVCH